jgi:hypothetical protein
MGETSSSQKSTTLLHVIFVKMFPVVFKEGDECFRWERSDTLDRPTSVPDQDGLGPSGSGSVII